MSSRPIDPSLIKANPTEKMSAPETISYKGLTCAIAIRYQPAFQPLYGVHDLYEGHIHPISPGGWNTAKLYYSNFEARFKPSNRDLEIELSPTDHSYSVARLCTCVEYVRFSIEEAQIEWVRLQVVAFFADYMQILESDVIRKQRSLPF